MPGMQRAHRGYKTNGQALVSQVLQVILQFFGSLEKVHDPEFIKLKDKPFRL
jgi:hypothetical protein